MCKKTSLYFFLAATFVLGLSSTMLLAGDGNDPFGRNENAALAPERALRQIFVPFSDLHVILEQQPKRVLLGREEYEALVKKAKKQPAEAHAPQPAAVVAAEYDAAVQSQRAEISGRLVVDVFDDGLHALPLDLGGVGLKNTTLDGKNAAIGRDAFGRLVLFVEGRGRHELSLDMVAPLETTAARQSLNFRLPRTAAAKLHLTVPGDVEIKGGADVMRRDVDATAKVTRFELLPHAGDTSILMTLNSHLHRQDFAVVAKSVLIDEVTQAYEKLYTTVSLDVLYRAVDHFRFAVPEGFEILEVNSPLLARWDVQKEGGRKVLGVTLREQTAESVVLKIAAIRTPAKLDAWKAPRLEPLDVVGGMTVVGLLVEDRLKVESLAAEKLIPIDVTDLGRTLPVFAGESNNGRPALRAVAAWYAPQLDFSLAANYKKPPAELAVNTSLLLVVNDRGQVISGGVSLLPLVEKRFTFDIAVPTGWQIKEVTDAAGNRLTYERYANQGGAASDAASRIRVTVPGGMPAGREFKANFHAERTPPGWLAAWTSQTLEFPEFAVLNATRAEGAVAVDGQDDLKIRPAKLAHLVPLNAAEKPKYGLADVATQLAYRYDNPKYAASLVVERARPRLTARTFSFVRIEPDALNCHYELIYAIENAKTRQLAFWLPKDTPATSVSIIALDGLKIKEFSSEEKEGRRRWNVSLVEAARKQVRLAVDFQQPLPKQEPKDYALPLISADGVAYQSGMAAVEGCAELEVRTNTAARAVDVGELADAEYQPGSRLLGAYGFVGDLPTVKIDVLRHPVRAIYPAIVQRCELDTNLSPDGVSQTQARFLLRTKSLYLQVKLPAGAELWSAELDGVPLKPQRQNDSILIDVPASKASVPQTLQLVYAASVRSLGARGTIDVLAPKLLLRAEQKATAVEVPLADLVWRVRLPNGYDLVDAGGTVSPEPSALERPRPAALEVASAIYTLSGGVGNCGLLLPASQAAREPSRRMQRMNELKQIELAAQNAAQANRGEPQGSRTADERTALNVDAPAKRYPAGKPEYDDTGLSVDHDSEFKAMGGKISGAEDSSVKAPAMPKPPCLEPLGRVMFGVGVNSDAGLVGAAVTLKNGQQSFRSNMSGSRSLKIDLTQAGEALGRVVSFSSFGVEPMLSVTLANRQRVAMLGWGLALLVALVGMSITRRSFRRKTAFVLIVAIIATLIPLATASIEVAWLCNMLFYAASFLVPYYLITGVVRHVFGWRRRLCPHCAASASTAAVLLMLMATAAEAQDSTTNRASDGRPYVIQVVNPEPPVRVPDDAIILPYDPDWKNITRDADRLLLPYERYVELWNRAYPDKKIETRTPPAPYALAGATYATQLEGEEFLGLTGRIEIDVMADGYVEIPLSLHGGVLAAAELDGQPAKLRVMSNHLNAPARFVQQQAMPQQQVDASTVSLFVSGKGRHKLELSVRLKLVRQGGWRVVQGILPSAPAAKLSIIVPQPKTELRLGLVADRRKYDTTLAGEKIETALGFGGSIQLQWRPAVAEGQIDRSLTAVSAAVLDVQEDGLRLAWQLGLEFRRGQRDRFRVDLPAGYLLEKVEGQNVRGWELQKTERGPAVEIVLLQQAKDYEQFILRLWRADSVERKDRKDRKEMIRFDAPQVVVPDAALHTGQLTIRRSPLLDLRTTDRSGVSRTDLPGDDSRLAALVGGRESSLKIRPFEAYTFVAVPFMIKFEAEPTAARTSAAAQTIVKISASERKFETCVRFDAQGRPAYQLRMFLPDDLRVDEVSAPGDFQYAVTRLHGRPLLTVYLAVGRQGETPVIVRGRLTREVSFHEKLTDAPLPRLEVFDVDGRPVDRQEGDVAVEADPAYDIDAVNLNHCETVLLDQVLRWLDASQRKITRLALHYRSGDYAGTLRLTPRKPEVACDTITNVRVTDRALEETILLDFSIQNAGIREFSFLLPAEMAESRIKAPMLRQKTIERAGKEPDSPIRVKIELQDEVMGQLRVLVENDRLLKPGSHEAPMPAVELGRIGRRYVTIENVGRDEIVVDSDKSRDMEQLGTRQKDWARLTSILGREMTMAYVVSSDARHPRLAFHAEARATVVTVKAEIGLAETTLAVDADGAYRASQLLNMNNATEQFLEIRLPEGAELWTAYVAGEPVKPVQSPAAVGAKAATRDVRIPIIKTAPGQSDYQVVLKYGGKMPTPTALREVNFPLIRSLNIAPERSQVRLYVPEDYRWFDFGGTMRRTDEEADLLAGFINYNSKQLSQVAMAFQQGDKWTRARASANIKVQKEQADANQRAILSSNLKSNAALQAELAANGEQWRQTAESLARQEQAPAKAEADNRKQLNLAFESQQNGLAKNVVELSDANTYGGAANAPAGGEAMDGETSSFNGEWLVQNKLIEEDKLLGTASLGLSKIRVMERMDRSGWQQAANGPEISRDQKSAQSTYGILDRVTPIAKNGYALAVPQSPSAAQVNGEKFSFMGSTRSSGGPGTGLRKAMLSPAAKQIAQQEEENEDISAARPSGEQRYQERAEQQAQQQQLRQNVAQAKSPNLWNNSAPYGATSPAIAGNAAPGEFASPQSRPNAPAPAAPAAREPMPQFRQDSGKLTEARTNADFDSLIDLKEKVPSGTAVDLPAAGLASLDVELPTRGRLFCFTTPRGETEITARCVSNNLLQRLTEVGATVAALLALWIVVRWIRRGGLSGFARPIGSTLLIVLGLLSICGGLFPVVGVLAIFTGCGLKIRRVCRR